MNIIQRIKSGPWSTVGNTPLIEINDKIVAKLETFSPTGSIKDRPIKYIVEKAIRTGKVTPETTLVEASSGNTGIALASIGAALGLKVIIIMPINMSLERRHMINCFGATVQYVGPSDFKGAISLRNEISSRENFWSPMQFENSENIDCHASTTAIEIASQLEARGENWGAFVSGAGTGGTIMGVKKFASKNAIDIFANLVVPNESPHEIQGIGDGDDYLVDRSLIDSITRIPSAQAIEKAKQYSKDTGLLIGISAAANLIAAEKLSSSGNISGKIVTIICDRGERYFSIFCNKESENDH